MALRLRAELPALEGVTEWVNGAPDMAQLQGRPVLVHFWAVSCSCCKDGLPILNDWRDRFQAQYGLQLIGVHMPRTEQDRNIAETKRMIEQYKLRHPVAIDNEQTVNDAFLNEYVPAYYLFDAQGQMRFYGAGEKALGMVEQRIHKLLGSQEEA
ncbi:redoxin domain-containing protein [Paenibacillus koleovorans]|uniref:redoxin domain-containing protein n=1 Tax=Paenibacillus koleovorans TaxID=121608 RepID=UPI001FE26184|nr:redoxin domain-containing protein [Paenibacillus koleovorans]